VDPHNRLILEAAREHLTAVGAVQKGRSRTWIDDRAWFVTVVEFQASGFGKGSYLNVGTHFMWTWREHLSFDLASRVERFCAYESDAQFAPEAQRLARRAAQEVLATRERLRCPNDLIDFISTKPEASGWLAYHAAVALGLSGRIQEAHERFARAADGVDDRAPWVRELRNRCSAFATSVLDPPRFRESIISLIMRDRERLRLPQLLDPLTG